MRGPALFPQKAPLESHPAFRASHYDALKQAVATQLSAKFVDLPSHPAALDARANRFDLPQSSLWFCSYGIPIAIEFPEPDHVRLQFHHAGVGATWIGNDLVPVTPDQACVTSTAAEFDLGEGYEQIVWRISKDAFEVFLHKSPEAGTELLKAIVILLSHRNRKGQERLVQELEEP